MSIQIIDENQNFTNEKNILSKWQMDQYGFNYNVVSVFGSQSTGKSTLLNHVFGTEFDIMDAHVGRNQTTKGIWLSKAQNSNILILDVEGTDGRERGDNQDFERKSALFSLATTEVLIINMWEQQIGLYNGANMSLLRTVMEVNLQLFQSDNVSKTLLYFVLRDSTGLAPLETLCKTLTADMDKIWESLAKVFTFNLASRKRKCQDL
jgi:GTPase Era involved in 16S rRNA processing